MKWGGLPAARLTEKKGKNVKEPAKRQVPLHLFFFGIKGKVVFGSVFYIVQGNIRFFV